jgi:RNA polymerase sigma factor (TIGR02999 family)
MSSVPWTRSTGLLTKGLLSVTELDYRGSPRLARGCERKGVATALRGGKRQTGVLILTIASKCESLWHRVARAMETNDPTVATLIALAEQGDEASSAKLFTLLYAELHRLAKRQLARQGDISLSATTLIHEAYLDMAGQEGQSFPDQGRFMAYAARVMRGLIIDHVRNRLAIKRGGKFELTSLTTNVGDAVNNDQELTRISQALDELARVDNSLSQIVDLKFFCGFSFGEIADMTTVSERTVQRKWEKARIYLHRTLRADLPL